LLVEAGGIKRYPAELSRDCRILRKE